MKLEEFWQNLGMGYLIAIFAVSAMAIWWAGTRLEKMSVQIGHKLNLGQIFAGTILLAVATSLPEIATSVTATLRGHPQLAVFNILGSVVVQLFVLAISDGLGQKQALTGKSPSLALIMQGCSLIFLLAFTLVVVCVNSTWEDNTKLGMFAPLSIALIYGLSQYIVMRTGRNPSWKPADENLELVEAEEESGKEKALSRLFLFFALFSMVIAVGGWATVITVEQIAARTGASQNFLGFTLVALATSLPELGTTLTASRRNHGVVAISNIFGSNCFVLALLGLVAVMHGGNIFEGQLISTVFAAGLGIILTVVYLVGLLELQQKTVARMGWDSFVAIGVSLAGLWLMFSLSQ
jgi:cation:H+ antiporter